MQRDGELDGAEAAGEVAADLGAERDQLLAQLARHLRQLGAAEVAQRARLIDRRKQLQRRPPSGPEPPWNAQTICKFTPHPGVRKGNR